MLLNHKVILRYSNFTYTSSSVDKFGLQRFNMSWVFLVCFTEQTENGGMLAYLYQNLI